MSTTLIMLDILSKLSVLCHLMKKPVKKIKDKKYDRLMLDAVKEGRKADLSLREIEDSVLKAYRSGQTSERIRRRTYRRIQKKYGLFANEGVATERYIGSEKIMSDEADAPGLQSPGPSPGPGPEKNITGDNSFTKADEKNSYEALKSLQNNRSSSKVKMIILLVFIGTAALFAFVIKPVCNSAETGAGTEKAGSAALQPFTVYFKLGSASLPAGLTEKINLYTEAMRNDRSLSIEIHGHSCDIGETDNNMWISKQRAENIRQRFIESGIDSSRLKISAHGDSNPAAANKTPEGRALNRRVRVQLQTDN